MSTEPLEKKKWTAEDMADQSGKVFIITGANSGLGFEATRQLAKKNATVVMACRNEAKGTEAMAEIKEEVPDAKLEVMVLDLSDFSSIKGFAETFSKKYDRLDALLNNAGIMQPPYRKTKDDLELQIGVNHFGHYMLTGLLMDKLKATSGSRVVSQSSMAAAFGSMNFDDINSEESYSRTGAYGQSKLANILFAFELDRKIQDAGIDVKAVAVHPGYTATNLQQNGPTVGGKSFLSRIYSVTNRLIAQHVSKGALPMLYAATASDVEGGDYIGPKNARGMRGYPKRIEAPKQAYREEDAAKLWEISEEITGITYPLKK